MPDKPRRPSEKLIDAIRRNPRARRQRVSSPMPLNTAVIDVAEELRADRGADQDETAIREELEQARTRIQAIEEATILWRDRPGGDVGLAIALANILDTDRPEPPASAALVRVLRECDRIEREVYGQHDEDDDGMREAVRRIRAAAGAGQDG